MPALRLRSPFPGDGSRDDSYLPKSPTGAYTGENYPPLPLTKPFLHRLILLLAACLMIVVLFLFGVSNRVAAHVPWKRNLMPRDVIPKFPLVSITFQNEWEYQQAGQNGDMAWHKMLPRGNGMVQVQDAARYGLPRSAAALDAQQNAIKRVDVYEVAVVKQLECLLFIRDVFVAYDRHHIPNVASKMHLQHCIDYVRQSILCAADTTLEPTSDAVPEHHEDSHYMDNGGVGVNHTCKNWPAIKGWLEDNRYQSEGEHDY